MPFQMTALTAGRILWIRRAASRVGLDTKVRGRYSTAMRIVLESGAIACMAAIIMAITVSLPDKELYDIMFGIGQQAIQLMMISLNISGLHTVRTGILEGHPKNYLPSPLLV
ncbi:hypothetical protein B0H14DRAFT_3453606 [Mycena olivaceomarginata]|nr:hypothetical protein B0H14DRAFT_3453606 [Mycena olivaceomarginata]